MEIIVGKTAGFCQGVKRAVEGAKQELAESQGEVHCLGEIVHNKQVIQQLEEKGLTIINKWQEAKGKIIIRAHGIAKTIEQEMKQANLEIKDFTCPRVIAVHKTAEKYSQQNYYVFLLGAKNHPENQGTISYCGNSYSIIEDETQVEKAINEFQNSRYHKLLIISQTTYHLTKFEKIKEMIIQKIGNYTEVVAQNTICQATELRQKETAKLAKQVDRMIIIGGKNSSNTKKLYEIAKGQNVETIWIESPEELEEDGIAYEKIGIMAGASTPYESIQSVVKSLKEKELIQV
jgi:4-hydroxy-3-methylbut-2-enyl diphosphate reductase